jgi:hypothetical protein
MKQNNLNVYYGILFLFLYSRIYSIIVNVFVSCALLLKINAVILPFVLGIIVLAMVLLFSRIKTFPSVKLWMIVLIIIISSLLNYFFTPFHFYAGEDAKWSLLTYSITCSRFLFEILIILIAYLKYRKTVSQQDVSL